MKERKMEKEFQMKNGSFVEKKFEKRKDDMEELNYFQMEQINTHQGHTQWISVSNFWRNF